MAHKSKVNVYTQIFVAKAVMHSPFLQPIVIYQMTNLTAWPWSSHGKTVQQNFTVIHLTHMISHSVTISLLEF